MTSALIWAGPVAIVALLIGRIVLARWVESVPIGYQDEAGFHFGEQVFRHFDNIPASDADR